MDDTSGVGCNTDGFDTSDGEDEEIMAQFLEQSLSKSTPDKPNLNSTHPMATPKMSTERRPSGPRKLTKGSRRSSLKDSGLNLINEWEDSRRMAQEIQPAENIIHETIAEEIEEIDLTEMEISQFEAGDNDVFETSSDSFVEIPSDAEK